MSIDCRKCCDNSWKYLVGYRTNPKLFLTEDVEEVFDFEDCRIVLWFDKADSGNPTSFFVFNNGSNNLDAQALAIRSLDRLIASLSLFSRLSISISDPFVVLKNQCGEKLRITKRSVSKKINRPLTFWRDNFDSVKDLLGRDLTKNQRKAVSFLHKACTSKIYSEMFMNYWKALEKVVGGIMKANYCKNCGADAICQCGRPVMHYGSNTKKAKRLLKKFSDGKIGDVEYEKIEKTRHKISHDEDRNADCVWAIEEVGIGAVVEQIIAENLGVENNRVAGPIFPEITQLNKSSYIYPTRHPEGCFALDYPEDSIIERFVEEQIREDKDSGVKLSTDQDW